MKVTDVMNVLMSLFIFGLVYNKVNILVSIWVLGAMVLDPRGLRKDGDWPPMSNKPEENFIPGKNNK